MTSRRDVTSGGPAVDLVYTWVDGDDAQFQADIRQYASGSKQLNPERMRDPYDLLRYSLRSTAMFAPWIRKVHIVTRRPQVPKWLDLDNPRVNVVHHDELRAHYVGVMEGPTPGYPGSDQGIGHTLRVLRPVLAVLLERQRGDHRGDQPG